MQRLAFLIVVAFAPALALSYEPRPVEETLAARGVALGFSTKEDVELKNDVARIGEVPFLSKVTFEFLNREEMRSYFTAIFDEEYPVAEAEADQRMLVAFDLLSEGVDLREMRGRLLEENVVGFYDERPGKKRLFVVSHRRGMTPLNRMILAHELRHALQDQHIDVHTALPRDVGDFDDRRVALMCLLEGDATWLMERYLDENVPEIRETALDALWTLDEPLGAEVPRVLQDQLVLPYARGRAFARALWDEGGWQALRRAWDSPPRSTEQVLHPEKYRAREAPLVVAPPEAPKNGRLVREGVLGEILIRTLLGGETEDAAASGWGGDFYRVWDVRGRTLLLWRCAWDTERDEEEFSSAIIARLTRSHGRSQRIGDMRFFKRGSWNVVVTRRDGVVLFGAADDAGILLESIGAR